MAEVWEATLSTLRACAFAYSDEDRLQQGIAQALCDAGLEPQREIRLAGRGRIDLMVGRIGIEVKVAGSVADVRRQVARYLEHDEIDGLILVTNRVRHRLPTTIHGKPVAVVSTVAAGL